MKKIDYTELGGTLFIPAVHKGVESVVLDNKYPLLKSVLIDFEDSLKADELSDSLEKFKSLLEKLNKKTLLLFVRPKDSDFLKTLLELEHIERVDGFILPKFSLLNCSDYLELLKDKEFHFMPSIEGSELFDTSKLIELKDILLPFKEKIVLVRYGLEDMLRQLGMKRKCNESIFDFASTSSVLGNFIAVFKSAGFVVSGGVYPCFKDENGFRKDVLRDLKEGLFSKTIIHPYQIEMINELYKVTQKEFDEALEIVYSKNVVFAQDGKMAETLTMTPYCETIIKRAQSYGVN